MKRRAESREGWPITTIAFPPKMYEALRAVSYRERVAISEVVREAVAAWLAKRAK